MSLKKWIKNNYDKTALILCFISIILFLTPFLNLIGTIGLVLTIILSFLSFGKQGVNWKAILAIILALLTFVLHFIFVMYLLITGPLP
jgi:hypothetical protein